MMMIMVMYQKMMYSKMGLVRRLQWEYFSNLVGGRCLLICFFVGTCVRTLSCFSNSLSHHFFIFQNVVNKNEHEFPFS